MRRDREAATACTPEPQGERGADGAAAAFACRIEQPESCRESAKSHHKH